MNNRLRRIYLFIIINFIVLIIIKIKAIEPKRNARNSNSLGMCVSVSCEGEWHLFVEDMGAFASVIANTIFPNRIENTYYKFYFEVKKTNKFGMK